MRSRLRALAVAVTVAPACAASWTAYPPTAPPAPFIRMLCPVLRPACSNSACQAASPAVGRARLGHRQKCHDRVVDIPTAHALANLGDGAGQIEVRDVGEGHREDLLQGARADRGI